MYGSVGDMFCVAVVRAVDGVFAEVGVRVEAGELFGDAVRVGVGELGDFELLGVATCCGACVVRAVCWVGSEALTVISIGGSLLAAGCVIFSLCVSMLLLGVVALGSPLCVIESVGRAC